MDAAEDFPVNNFQKLARKEIESLMEASTEGLAVAFLQRLPCGHHRMRTLILAEVQEMRRIMHAVEEPNQIGGLPTPRLR